MKKLLLSTTLLLALVTSTAVAQRAGRGDKIKLQDIEENGYTINRYIVKEKTTDGSDEFKMHYRINLNKLLSSYDENSDEIRNLHKAINAIKNDTLKQITHFEIVGYTSPEGSAALNEKLAMRRASDCETYLDKKCGMERYPRLVKGKCNNWKDAKSAIQSSATPNKRAIITEIDNGNSQMAIESKLRQQPQAWAYIVCNTLPPMRGVDVDISYNQWRLIEEREALKQPASRTVIIDMGYGNHRDIYGDDVSGVLFAMPDNPIDFDDCKVRGERKRR